MSTQSVCSLKSVVTWRGMLGTRTNTLRKRLYLAKEKKKNVSTNPVMFKDKLNSLTTSISFSKEFLSYPL